MNIEELTRNEIQEFEWLVEQKLGLICFHNHKEGDIYKFFLGKEIFGKERGIKSVMIEYKKC